MMVQHQKTTRQIEQPIRPCDFATAQKALLATCAEKKQRLLPIAGEIPSKAAFTGIDLVILVDTSDSMRDDINGGVLSVLGNAVDALHSACAAPLRVRWFGIEGVWLDTSCQQSYRNYLLALGIPETLLLGRRKDSLPHQGAQEDGARAIIDLAHHYDWRPGAWRGLFYLGDEGLAGGDPNDAADLAAAQAAAQSATACAVTLFTYAGTGSDGKQPDLATEAAYMRLALATGGRAYRTPSTNLRRFAAELQGLACPTANGKGQTVIIQPVRPCFTLEWGESADDLMETNGRETIAIVAANPYTNVIFHDLTLVSAALYWQADQCIPALPDGTPSVTLTPARLLDFGTVTRSAKTETEIDITSVTRSVELYSRGARPGDYTYAVCCHYRAEIVLTACDEFQLDLVPS